MASSSIGRHWKAFASEPARPRRLPPGTSPAAHPFRYRSLVKSAPHQDVRQWMEREIDTGPATKPGIASYLIATSFSLTVLALFVVYLSFF